MRFVGRVGGDRLVKRPGVFLDSSWPRRRTDQRYLARYTANGGWAGHDHLFSLYTKTAQGCCRRRWILHLWGLTVVCVSCLISDVRTVGDMGTAGLHCRFSGYGQMCAEFETLDDYLPYAIPLARWGLWNRCYTRTINGTHSTSDSRVPKATQRECLRYVYIANMVWLTCGRYGKAVPEWSG